MRVRPLKSLRKIAERIRRYGDDSTRAALIAAKRVLQPVLEKKRADVFFECAADWRYPSYLLRAFRAAGLSKIEVPVRAARFMLENSNYAEFFSSRVRVIAAAAVSEARLIVSRQPAAIAAEAEGRVRVSIDYFSPEMRAAGIVMPYFFHPELWPLEAEFARYRKAQRRFRIGFAGTINDRDYAGRFRFPLMNRTQVFQTIRVRFAGETKFVTSAAEYERRRAQPPPVTIVATDAEGDTTRKHVLRGRRYLEFLGDCAFFLAAPGYAMPFAHNLVEAMFLGAIPILNYPQYLEPALEDGINCLSFSTADELSYAIERALCMIAKTSWRRASPRSLAMWRITSQWALFARKLRENLRDGTKIVVNAESEKRTTLGGTFAAQADFRHACVVWKPPADFIRGFISATGPSARSSTPPSGCCARRADPALDISLRWRRR